MDVFLFFFDLIPLMDLEWPIIRSSHKIPPSLATECLWTQFFSQFIEYSPQLIPGLLFSAKSETVGVPQNCIPSQRSSNTLSLGVHPFCGLKYHLIIDCSRACVSTKPLFLEHLAVSTAPLESHRQFLCITSKCERFRPAKTQWEKPWAL